MDIHHKSGRFHEIFREDTMGVRQRLINVLEGQDPNPLITVRLTQSQMRSLSEYLMLLPYEDFQILALHYCLRLSPQRIERQLKMHCCKGTIAYLQDRLTQCMGLTRPIGEHYWRVCVNWALDLLNARKQA